MVPTIALASWPVITLILFVSLGPARGLIWAVVVGYLFLPDNFGFDLPGLPPYDKKTAISFSLLLPAILYWNRIERTPAQDYLLRVVIFTCILAMILGSYGTYWQNRTALFNGPLERSALSLRDVVSMTSDTVLIMLPLILSWHFLRKPEHHRHLLVAMVIMGVIYTLPVLFELRMSPQLNKWIYGYFPHNWRQHLRGGGYRPLVFLEHGLSLGFYLLSVAVASMALFRDKMGGSNRFLFLMAGGWCFLVLATSRNLGATMLAFLFIPMVLVLSLRAQVRVSAVLAVILLSYPILSTASLSPATRMLEVLSPISPERAQSFQFRLENEHMLIERAMKKPAFGWGGFGRQRVYDDRGRDLTVTDGLWIITLGQGGWVRYLAFFTILTAPLLFLRRAARRKKISAPIAGMAVIMGANFVYMIPNSTLSPVAIVILGAIAAFVQYDTATDEVHQPRQPGAGRRQSRYSRFAPTHGPPGAEPPPSRQLTRPALGPAGRT